MKRKTLLLKAAALVALLGTTCPFCDSSCVASEPPGTLEGDHALTDLFARSDAASATPAMKREWFELRVRYQEALRRNGPSPLLEEARLGASATLAASPAARARFREALGRVDVLARAGFAPSAAEMAALHRHLLTDPAAARLRKRGERATAGVATDRAYLAGALVEDHLDRVFASLASEHASRDVSLTPALAARLDQKLVSIHPYVDGNGRIARLMADWLLFLDGYPPIVATRSAALHATPGTSEPISPAAHLERVTEGMRTAVLLAECAAPTA